MAHKSPRFATATRRLATFLFCAAVIAPKMLDASISLPMAGTRTALQLLDTKPSKSTSTNNSVKGDSSQP